MGLAVVAAVSLLAAAAPAKADAAERLYSETQARALLEKLLLDNILPFWYPGVIDDVHGGYRLNHDAEGKAGPWKGPYHNGRAVLTCLEALDAID